MPSAEPLDNVGLLMWMPKFHLEKLMPGPKNKYGPSYDEDLYSAHIYLARCCNIIPLVIGNLLEPKLYSAPSELFSPDTHYRDTARHIIASPEGHPIEVADHPPTVL